MLPPGFTRLTAALAASLLVVVASAAEPKGSATSARLEVLADPGCATRADLGTRVRARSPRVTLVESGGALAIRVQLTPLASGAVAGEVTFTSSGAKPSARRVVAASCSEAADAVALIIAVTLDPTSADRSEAAPSGSSGDGASGAAGKDTPGPPSAAPSAEKPRSKPEGPAPASSSASHPSTTSSSRSRPTFGATLAAQSFLGPAPSVMPGVALYALAGLDRPALWSPAALLGATHAWRTGLVESGGTASFQLDAASFDACPFRFRLGAVEARPCGSALIGRLSARGTQTRNPAGDSTRPFWVLGGAAVVSADLVWLLEASARFALGVNLVRDSFEFAPQVFHTVPLVTGAASVGLGLRWR